VSIGQTKQAVISAAMNRLRQGGWRACATHHSSRSGVLLMLPVLLMTTHGALNLLYYGIAMNMDMSID
jgi:hypothetical protein